MKPNILLPFIYCAKILFKKRAKGHFVTGHPFKLGEGEIEGSCFMGEKKWWSFHLIFSFGILFFFL